MNAPTGLSINHGLAGTHKSRIKYISYQKYHRQVTSANFVRTICETQNLLISVERVLEYSQKPTEVPVKTGVMLPENWPQKGHVVFKNYST
ncbi:hypothetical protein BGX30_006536, partial [Mortierella sp. GBA39]